MINYSDNKNLKKLLNLEIISLESTLEIQKNLNKQLLTFMKNFIGNVDIDIDFSPQNKTFSYINKSSACLTKSNSNIHSLNLLLNYLHKLNALIEKSKNSEKIVPAIEKYNKKFKSSIETIYKNTEIIQKFLFLISSENIESFENSKEKKSGSVASKKKKRKKENVDDIVITSKELELSYLENTLVISDIQGKVLLPYTIETLKDILFNDNSYTSLDDVINKLYTVPLERYKFSSIARFKEAYKLITEKEHGSRFKALSLASELFFNYNLHPAIITACKNLDELDIYLACLEDNELDKFKFFNIKYEIAPTVSTSNI